MAANKKKKKGKPSTGGGSLMSMRSGMRRVAGTGKKGKRKPPTSFQQVFTWVALVFAVGILVWAMTR